MRNPRRAKRVPRSVPRPLVILSLSLSLFASLMLTMSGMALAADLVSSELRITSAFWDDAVLVLPR